MRPKIVFNPYIDVARPRKKSRKGVLNDEYIECVDDIDRNHPLYKKAHRIFYDSLRWSKVRDSVMREHPLCYRCKQQGKFIEGYLVDHLLQWTDKHDPLSQDTDNMYTLCASCHGAISNIENRYGDEWLDSYHSGASFEDIAKRKYGVWKVQYDVDGYPIETNTADDLSIDNT